MDLNGIQSFNNQDITSQVNEASSQLKDIHKTHPKENIPQAVRNLIPVLESCDSTFTSTPMSPDPKLDDSVEELLTTLEAFKKLIKQDKATQEKVSFVQGQLFNNFTSKMEHLEETLKRWALRRWREERNKVQKVNPTKDSTKKDGK